METQAEKRKRRQGRIRAKVNGTSERPRLAVFKSNKHITAQLIDDVAGKTLVASGDIDIKDAKKKTGVERATAVGEILAEKAGKKKIEKAVFDRGGFKYSGAIKALADGARKGGLIF